MNVDRRSVLPAACQGGDLQETSCRPKPPSFAFSDAFSERLWKSMRLSPKTLACEKDFYLKALRVPEKARVVWKCVPPQGCVGRTGKNGKAKGKAKLQEPLGSLESVGGNLAVSKAKPMEPSRKRKVLSCTSEKGAAGRLVSRQSAASNTQQVAREACGPESSANHHHPKIKRPTPLEETSNQSNSCHKIMSNNSGGTVEHASSRSDWKSSGGSMNNLSTHGSVAVSQNRGICFVEGNSGKTLEEKGIQSRRSSLEDLSKAAQDGDRSETMTQQFHTKLQRLIVKPLALGDGTPLPSMKVVEDSARGERQESVAMNDEEVAMQLHQVLNAPSLRSHVRRNCTGMRGSSARPDSASYSKTKSCTGWSKDDSRSRSSGDDYSCLPEERPVA